MNKVKFSVLLSIYYKEKPEYFRECMEAYIRRLFYRMR